MNLPYHPNEFSCQALISNPLLDQSLPFSWILGLDPIAVQDKVHGHDHQMSN